MTLEKIRAALPTHIMLTPGVDVWQDGDEFFDIVDLQWDTIAPPQYTQKVNGIAARRPIPQDVRESAAWWLLYNTLAEVVPASRELGVTFYIAVDALGREKLIVTREHADLNTRRFTDRLAANDATLILGGEQRIIKELSAGPDPLGRWILAGKP